MTQDELTDTLNRLKDRMCQCDDGCKSCKEPTKILSKLEDEVRVLKLTEALQDIAYTVTTNKYLEDSLNKYETITIKKPVNLNLIAARQIKEEEEPSELGERLNGSMKGKKNDTGKPMFTCLPAKALLELGKVAELGARKYGLHNYRKGIAVSRTLDAAMRHLLKAIDGEELDPVDGNNHLISVAWNCLVAFNTLLEHPPLDDRFKGDNNE